MTAGDAMPSEDDYENAFYYFQKAMAILSADATTQCEAMDYFNVAWEIRDDLSRGADAVLDLAGSRLSEQQKEAILRLKARLASLPSTVVYVENDKKEHLCAMNSPVWVPLRLDAKELIQLLGSETTRISSIFG